MTRLSAGDVACWLIKTSRPPRELVPGWSPGTTRTLTRCLRNSYRLTLMAPGHPCVLWRSGAESPGVHAAGTLAGVPEPGPGGPEIAVQLTLLSSPIPRRELLADPDARETEVLRMPAGSNPSWLSPEQYAAVLARIRLSHIRLGPSTP